MLHPTPRPTSRPYGRLLSADLERVARDRWNDPTGLQILRAELALRSRLRAQRLAARVDVRLRELQSERVGAEPPAAAPSDPKAPSGGAAPLADANLLAAARHRVGQNAHAPEVRHAALRRLIEGEIAPLGGESQGWSGTPGSAERLERVARNLASLARRARESGPALAGAADAWAADLAFLKATYYDGRFARSFAWPTDGARGNATGARATLPHMPPSPSTTARGAAGRAPRRRAMGTA